MRDAVEILKRARDIIAQPECWHKGHYAQDEQGEETCDTEKSIEEYMPVCFCTLGALSMAVADHPFADDLDGFLDWERFVAARNAFQTHTGIKDIPAWNDRDDTTHADVLKAFDTAIEKAEATS